MKLRCDLAGPTLRSLRFRNDGCVFVCLKEFLSHNWVTVMKLWLLSWSCYWKIEKQMFGAGGVRTRHILFTSRALLTTGLHSPCKRQCKSTARLVSPPGLACVIQWCWFQNSRFPCTHYCDYFWSAYIHVWFITIAISHMSLRCDQAGPTL